jgi:hypothetical protein
MLYRNLIIALALGAVGGLLIYYQSVNLNIPGNSQGFAPEQPLAFSHRLHSGDLKIDCQYCHTGAARGPGAGLPSASTCMNCHRFVTAGWDKVKKEEQDAEKEKRDIRPVVSPEIEKLYASVGFSASTMSYQETPAGTMVWKRVHDLPDFVFFDHSRHVTAGVACQTCHGPVETMEKVYQNSDLSMGWCVNCHRDVNQGKVKELEGRSASLNCAVCHY